MRKLIPVATAIAIVSALVASVTASTAATKATTIKCKSTEYNPTPKDSSGVIIGFTSCSKPLGNGVISATYSASVNTTTGAGTAHGTFTKWLATGTVHGRYTEKIQFTSDADATYKLATTITGGTGAFKGVKGSGPESCSTTNGGATQTCKSVLAVTGL